MAVTFVRATEGSIVNSVLTLNIEVSAGSDRVLVVGVALKSNSPVTPTSIIFNGVENFDVERIATDDDNAQCVLYYLIAPTETTANVVITMPGSVRMVGYVAYFTGVNQSSPFTENTVDAQGSDNAPTVDISSAADEVCIDILAQVSGGPDIATATHTEICNGAAIGGGTDTRGAGQYVVGQATRTMNYGMSDADDWNIIAGALQEPSAGGATVYPNLIVEDIVPYATTEKAGAKKAVNLLVASMVAFSVTVTAGAKTTISLLDQSIVPYAVTTSIGARATVNLLVQDIVPYSVSVKTSAVVPVNLLDANIVPYAPTPRADNQVTVNLLVQDITPYTATPKVNASAQVSLLVQDVVPYATTTKTGAKQQVNLLVQNVIPYAVTPRADNQVAVNLLIQNITPYTITTKTGATKVVSLLNQSIVLFSPTIKAGAKQIVSRLIQNITPYVTTPSTGGDIIEVVNLLTQDIIPLELRFFGIKRILQLITKTFSQFNITSHFSRGLNLQTKERSDLDITSIIKGGG